MAANTKPSSINLDAASEGYPNSFTIAAKSKTDVYASPKHGYRFNAPVIYHKISPSKFQRARVTVTLPWTLQYDQGGLILVQPAKGTDVPDGQTGTKQDTHPRWVKAGIEVKDGSAYVSIVARETWADWSLTPARSEQAGGGPADNVTMATLEFEKSGSSLKVLVHEGVTRPMVRQVQWVFDGHDQDIWIGTYAARPDPTKEADGQDLEVKFTHFEIFEDGQ